MYCPECGTEISDNAIFCSNCGVNISKLKRDEKTQHSEPIAKPAYMEPQSHRSYDEPTDYQQQQPSFEHLEQPQKREQTVQRDDVANIYIVLSFLFFPLGVVFWAYLKPRKPESSNKILIATVFGFFMLILFLGAIL